MLGKCIGRYWLAALTVLLTTGAIPSRADLVIGNLPGNDNNFSVIGQGFTAAMGFTMGSSSYALTDAKLVLALTDPSSNAPLLQLQNNVSGAPGTSLLTFTNPSLSAGTATYTFAPSTAFTLQSNTTYWLDLTSSNANGGPFFWLGNNPGSTPTGSGATFFGTTNGVLNSFQVDGVLVPEPSTLFIVVATAPLSGLGFWCFKRRRRAAA
ncbi:MAG: PEP-CTERM sorting domain-containing protein [Planctomycetaceae bacterium]|nr:PEP-CTERM sorting domain-containing protein [Planctomycetaceae bacterium]